VNYLQDVVVSV